MLAAGKGVDVDAEGICLPPQCVVDSAVCGVEEASVEHSEMGQVWTVVLRVDEPRPFLAQSLTEPFVKRGSREDDFCIQNFGRSNRWYIPHPSIGWQSLAPSTSLAPSLMGFADNSSAILEEGALQGTEPVRLVSPMTYESGATRQHLTNPAAAISPALAQRRDRFLRKVTQSRQTGELLHVYSLSASETCVFEAQIRRLGQDYQPTPVAEGMEPQRYRDTLVCSPQA